MYQPGITRLPSLLCLFLATLILIGLTEFAVRHYPHYDRAGIVHSVSQESLDPVHRLLRRLPQDATSNNGGTPPAGSSPAEGGTGADTGAGAGTQPGTGTGTGAGDRMGSDNVGSNPPTGGTPTDPEVPSPGGGGGGGKTNPTIAPNPDKFQPVGDPPPKQDPPTQDPPKQDDPPQNTTPIPPDDDSFQDVGGAKDGGGKDQSGTLPPPPPGDAFQGVGDKKPAGGDKQAPPAVEILPGSGGNTGQQPAPQGNNGGQPAANPQPGSNVPGSGNAPGASPGAAPQGTVPAATPFVDAAGNTIAAGVAATVGADGKQTPVATVGPDGKTVVPTPVGGSITAFSTGTAVGEKFTVGPSGVIVVDGTTFNTATPTVATLKNGKTVSVGPSGAVSIQDKAPLGAHLRVGTSDYIIGCFLPTILAVLFTIPWHILASAVKEVEPFYQLHKEEGATAGKSLALTYRASINIVSTFNAIRNGHFLVWWSGLVSLVVLILAPLSSETVFLAYVGPKSCDPLHDRSTCIPQLSVYPIAARVVQGVLSFVAVLTFGLMIMLLRAKSGVYSNPLSIAGLAALFQDQKVIDDFRRIRGFHQPEPKEIKEAMGENRYRIGEYADSLGNPRYGLHALSPATAPAEEINIQRASGVFGSQKYESVAVHELAVNDDDERSPHRNRNTTKKRRPWFRYGTHSITILVFSACVLGLMFLIIYYNRLPNTRAFEKFMTGGSFGVNFLFTSLGVLIKMYWTMLDDDLRLHTPYHLLLAAPQPAPRTILSHPPNNPFTGLFHSLFTQHNYLNALSSLIAILCEPLIVCLANVPFKPNLSWRAYIVSTWLSVAILTLMVICVAGLLVRRGTERGGEGFWGSGSGGREVARAPETVGGVLWLICGSHMVGEFGMEAAGGMAEMDDSEVMDRVQAWGKMYRLGAVVGLDGEERWGVDESVFVREEEES